MKAKSIRNPHLSPSKGRGVLEQVGKELGFPIHENRLSKDGICAMGPAKGGLPPVDEASQARPRGTWLAVLRVSLPARYNTWNYGLSVLPAKNESLNLLLAKHRRQSLE